MIYQSSFSKEILNERIVAFTIYNVNIDALQKWDNEIIQTLEGWPDTSYLPLLYDLSKGNVSMPFLVLTGRTIHNIGVTYSGRQIVDQILSTKPKLRVRLAFVFAETITGNITFRYAEDIDPTAVDPMCEFKAFFGRQLALDWLESYS